MYSSLIPLELYLTPTGFQHETYVGVSRGSQLPRTMNLSLCSPLGTPVRLTPELVIGRNVPKTKVGSMGRRNTQLKPTFIKNKS